MLSIKIKGKDQELKFNYSAFFKANELFSSKTEQDPEGKNSKDGASILWVNIVSGNDEAIYQALQVMLAKKYTKEDILSAIDTATDEIGVEEFALQVQEEMQKSGFFKRAAERWMQLTTTYVETMKSDTMTQQEKLQMKTIQNTLDVVKKSLS